MYATTKPFTAAQYTGEFHHTQMVDWLTVCGVPASRDILDGHGAPINGEGPPRALTAVGWQAIPFHAWVIPRDGKAVILTDAQFRSLFAEVRGEVVS